LRAAHAESSATVSTTDVPRSRIITMLFLRD
jgi:hypothetical protein